MSREIKFRAWDKKHEVMLTTYITHVVLNLKFIDPDGLELMQYTGLHDKNGKEIYEGDIVINKANNKQQVRYLVKEACFCCEDIPFLSEEDSLWNIEPTDEVIGNIYENPELLTKDMKR